MTTQSVWSAASVGKLSATLRKKWPRKWPRLLANKKMKIKNMHVWMESQARLDSDLGSMSTASNSPVTCGMSEKLYCLASDTCKKMDNGAAGCESCPGKTLADFEQHVCAGMPTEKATISFKDSDMDEHQIGGEVKITKARNEFDIDHYSLYWGKDERTKMIVEEGQTALIGEVEPTGHDTAYNLRSNVKPPVEATHILAFSKNKYGEYATPGYTVVRDAVLPRDKAKNIIFEDEDGDNGEVSGMVTIGKAADEALIDDYSLHWGRSSNRKISSSSSIHEMPKKDAGDVMTHYIARSTKVPATATHLLVFTKNEHGEMTTATSTRINDRAKPCDKADAPACVTSVVASKDRDPDRNQVMTSIAIGRAAEEKDVTHYAMYWGRQNCSDGGQMGAKNGHIRDVPIESPLMEDIAADTHLPEGTTHILVFSKNKLGESEFCKDVPFEDNFNSDLDQPSTEGSAEKGEL